MYIDNNLIFDVEEDTRKSAGYIGIHCGSHTVFKNIKVSQYDDNNGPIVMG